MRRIIITVLLLVLVSFIFSVFEYTRLHNRFIVVFCDVGQGDGAFIRTPGGKDILIDVGPDSSILGCLSSHMPFWDRKIDLIILSHFNMDHVAGIIDILNRYEVKRIGIPTQLTERKDVKNYMALFIDKNISIDDLDINDSYKIEDGVGIKTLGPKDNFDLIENNNTSLIQLLSYNNHDFLFTGDASFGVLNPILEKLGGSVEVLKVPHHGSKTGLNEESFKRFHPQVAIVSSGKKNRYGHPNREILDLLQKNNIEIRRTDEEGSIKFILK